MHRNDPNRKFLDRPMRVVDEMSTFYGKVGTIKGIAGDQYRLVFTHTGVADKRWFDADQVKFLPETEG